MMLSKRRCSSTAFWEIFLSYVAKAVTMKELFFLVEEDPESGYTAKP